MIVLDKLSFSVQLAQNDHKKILKEISFDTKDASIVSILGDNGAGKSSLLKTIAGFNPDYTGSIFIDGKVITKDLSDLSKIISYIPQDPKSGTVAEFTIEENLAFALRRRKTRGFSYFRNSKSKHAIQTALAKLNLGLEYRLNDYVGDLSGGQRQALSLIMGTIFDCKILLLDEITASLDPLITARLIEYIRNYAATHKTTILIVSHDIETSLNISDAIIVLHQGNVIKYYDKNELLLLSSDDIIRTVYGLSGTS